MIGATIQCVRRGGRGVRRCGRGGLDICRGALDELFPCVTNESWRDDDGGGWEPDDPEAYCVRCGASAGPGSAMIGGCAFCHGRRLAWQRLTRLGAYVPPLDERVRAMKFGGQWAWAAWFGQRLAERMGEPVDPRNLVVCPVPMYWFRRWRRGFNQAALMAEAIAHERGWPMIELLHRTRHTPPQTRVAPSQRQANIRDSFDTRPIDLTGCEVVLVDDVKTTGATLGACARLLRRMGARSVHGVVAAVADPKHQDFRIK